MLVKDPQNGHDLSSFFNSVSSMLADLEAFLVDEKRMMRCWKQHRWAEPRSQNDQTVRSEPPFATPGKLAKMREEWVQTGDMDQAHLPVKRVWATTVETPIGEALTVADIQRNSKELLAKKAVEIDPQAPEGVR